MHAEVSAHSGVVHPVKLPEFFTGVPHVRKQRTTHLGLILQDRTDVIVVRNPFHTAIRIKRLQPLRKAIRHQAELVQRVQQEHLDFHRHCRDFGELDNPMSLFAQGHSRIVNPSTLCQRADRILDVEHRHLATYTACHFFESLRDLRCVERRLWLCVIPVWAVHIVPRVRRTPHLFSKSACLVLKHSLQPRKCIQIRRFRCCRLLGLPVFNGDHFRVQSVLQCGEPHVLGRIAIIVVLEEHVQLHHLLPKQLIIL